MQAISSSLPYAVAIVLSTAPILAVVLVMVVTRPPRVSASFLLGWFAGVLVVTGLLVGFVDLSLRPRLPVTAAALVRLVLAAVVGAFAFRGWRERDTTPKWLANISRWGPRKALTNGFLLGSLNPKNLALAASGATAILVTRVPARGQPIAVLVFALIASLGIATPIVLREVGGVKLNRQLERAAQWMTANGKLLSVVVLAIIAVVLFSRGLHGLVEP